VLEPLVINLRAHVLTCTLCHAKGFICEICMNEKDIIFPFDLETTSVCQGLLIKQRKKINEHRFVFSLSVMLPFSMS
jgi:hypothetical protein